MADAVGPKGHQADDAGRKQQKQSKKKRKKQRAPRPFDMSRFEQRQVVLKILYFGEEYCGFAAQENRDNTIEQRLFEALLKTKLISSRAEANYSRSGRTDKGVSAYGQVVSLLLRSSRRVAAGDAKPGLAPARSCFAQGAPDGRAPARSGAPPLAASL